MLRILEEIFMRSIRPLKFFLVASKGILYLLGVVSISGIVSGCSSPAKNERSGLSFDGSSAVEFHFTGIPKSCEVELSLNQVGFARFDGAITHLFPLAITPGKHQLTISSECAEPSRWLVETGSLSETLFFVGINSKGETFLSKSLVKPIANTRATFSVMTDPESSCPVFVSLSEVALTELDPGSFIFPLSLEPGRYSLEASSCGLRESWSLAFAPDEEASYIIRAAAREPLRLLKVK